MTLGAAGDGRLVRFSSRSLAQSQGLVALNPGRMNHLKLCLGSAQEMREGNVDGVVET
jgi:hypothetical protein